MLDHGAFTFTSDVCHSNADLLPTEHTVAVLVHHCDATVGQESLGAKLGAEQFEGVEQGLVGVSVAGVPPGA